eukprot:scaffold102754_cov63-Phaeocystis_antarctica.AAC.6
MLSSLMARHAPPGEEHDNGESGGSGTEGGADGGDDGEGGTGGGDGSSGTEGGAGGAAQEASKMTDSMSLRQPGSSTSGRVAQVQLFALSHVPQPVSHSIRTVRSSCLNACLPIARSLPSYLIVSVARSDCAKPCCPTAVQPAVMVAHLPGTSDSLYSCFPTSALTVRHTASSEVGGAGDSGGGGGSDGGAEGGSGAEGGGGGAAQEASKTTDLMSLRQSGSRASGRVVQVQLLAPVQFPQPVSHSIRTVRSSSLNACLLIASATPSYSIVSVARSDCAKPCLLTTVQPAVIVAQLPGTSFPLYSSCPTSALTVRHTASGEVGGGGDSGGCGSDSGGAEGGGGGAAQEASKTTDSKSPRQSELKREFRGASGRVVQVQLLAPSQVPQPVSHSIRTVRSSFLNACLPIARSLPSYLIVSVARSDCAKPCCLTTVQPAVMVAQLPGTSFPLYSSCPTSALTVRHAASGEVGGAGDSGGGGSDGGRDGGSGAAGGAGGAAQEASKTTDLMSLRQSGWSASGR